MIGVAETMQPGFGQRLWDVLRNEARVVSGVLAKLALALLCVEALTWVLAAAPVPQPPAVLSATQAPAATTQATQATQHSTTR